MTTKDYFDLLNFIELSGCTMGSDGFFYCLAVSNKKGETHIREFPHEQYGKIPDYRNHLLSIVENEGVLGFPYVNVSFFTMKARLSDGTVLFHRFNGNLNDFADDKSLNNPIMEDTPGP